MPEFRPTEYEIEAYTHGDCWYLAKVLSEMSNKPMITVEYGRDHGDWFHVGLLVDKRTVLDIKGLYSRDDWHDEWGRKAGWPVEQLTRNIGKGHEAAPYLKNWMRKGADLSRLYPSMDTHKTARELLETHAPELLSV